MITRKVTIQPHTFQKEALEVPKMSREDLEAEYKEIEDTWYELEAHKRLIGRHMKRIPKEQIQKELVKTLIGWEGHTDDPMVL